MTKYFTEIGSEIGLENREETSETHSVEEESIEAAQSEGTNEGVKR